MSQNNGMTGNKFNKSNTNSVYQNQNYQNININKDIDIENSDNLQDYDCLDDLKKNALVLKMFKSYKASTDHDQIFRLLRFFHFKFLIFTNYFY